MPNDLSPDLARRIEELRGQGVPDGPAPTGSTLQVVSQMPFRYDWSQPPPGPVIRWHGNPDGDLNSSKGAICTDIDTPAVYQNQDGASSWEAVGAAPAKSGLYDDAYATITTASGSFSETVEFPTTLVAGDALLDFTNPDAPTVVEDGSYTIAVEIRSDNDTDGWFATLGLIHAAGPTGAGRARATVTPVAGLAPPAAVTLTAPAALLAGDEITVNVAGSGSHNFALAVTVSKVG